MKKVLSFLLMIILLLSCSSIKLLDSWQSKDFKNIKGEKILVAVKSHDFEIRKSYEKTIVKDLRKLGINAIEMHVKFPNFNDKESRTTQENNQIVKYFLNQGINMVMVNSLKNKIETRNYKAPHSVEMPKNHTDSLPHINNQLLNIKTLNSKKQVGVGGIKETTYVLESVTYDLSLNPEKRLINVCLVHVTDPKSNSKVLDKFSKIISSQFKK